MENDRTELNNLFGKNKPLEESLLKQYQAWADTTGVQDWGKLLPQLLKAWNMETVDGITQRNLLILLHAN